MSKDNVFLKKIFNKVFGYLIQTLRRNQ